MKESNLIKKIFFALFFMGAIFSFENANSQGTMHKISKNAKPENPLKKFEK